MQYAAAPPPITLVSHSRTGSPLVAIYHEIVQWLIVPVLSAIIRCTVSCLNPWRNGHKTRSQLSHYQRDIVDITRRYLEVLSGDNVVGLLVDATLP